MTEVHDLVYHGNGGFTYYDVYSMPIKYRKYHIQKINEYIEKRNEAEEKALKKSTLSNSNSPTRPNIPQADYT